MKRILLFTLSLAMIFSAVLPTAVAAHARTNTVVADFSEYDYSKPGSDLNITLTASEFLTELGYSLTDAEIEYLDAYCEFKLHYARVINDNVEKSIENDDVTVIAQPYTYVANNGKEVTMLPRKAQILDGEGNVKYEGDIDPTDHTATFYDAVIDKSTDTYAVLYELDGGVTVLKEHVNVLINFAYDSVIEPLTYYYSGNNAHLISDYFAYLEVKRNYDQQKAEHEAYLIAKQQYDIDLPKYNQYKSDYLEYQKAKNAYDEKYREYSDKLALYEKYQADVLLASAQVDNLNDALMTKVTYLDRQLYACLFSPLVDQVVANKDLITARWKDLGVHIDNSSLAAKNIHAILKPEGGKAYNKMTPKEQQAFYARNYNDLKKNILLLTNSLYLIYTTPGMKESMHLAASIKETQDYTEKLVIFISQLIYLCEVLSDEPLTFTDGQGKHRTVDDITFNYRNAAGEEIKKRSIKAVLEYKDYVVYTGKATPVTPVEVAKPEAPSEAPPVEPTKVLEPFEPEKVDNPGSAPTVVNMPSGMPTDFDWTEFLKENSEYQRLANAVYDEDIGKRDELTEDVVYTPRTYAEKPFDDESYVTLKFMDVDRTTVLATYTVKKLSAIDNVPSPSLPSDLAADYPFDKWVDANGNEYTDLHRVTPIVTGEDVILYPLTKTVYKEYPVNNKTLEVTTQDDLTHLPLTHFAEIVRGSNLSKLKVVAADVTLVLEFADLRDLADAGVSYLEIDTEVSSTSYSAQIVAYDANNQRVNAAARATVYLPLRNPDATIGNKHVVSKNAAAGTVHFKADIGSVCSHDVKYDIDNIEVYTMAPVIVEWSDSAAPGTVVTLLLDSYAISAYTGKGKRVEAFYVHNNTKTFIEGNSFVMPEGNVQIGVQITDVLYTVKFVVDGVEIYAKADCKYGDSIPLPKAPTKTGDGQYTYNFVGWICNGKMLGESDTVSGDAVYVAVFESIQAQDAKKGVNVFRVIFICGIATLVIGLLVLVLFILNKTGVISIKGIFASVGRLFRKRKKKDEANVVVVAKRPPNNTGNTQQ